MGLVTAHKWWLVVAIAALSGGYARSASAADSPMSVTLLAETRQATDNSGKSYQFVAASKLAQGQEVFYTLRIQNTSDKPVTGAEVIQAIPNNTRYIDGSANAAGAKIDFSLNGKDFMMAEELPKATRSTRDRQVTDYTYLRITLTTPLAPKAVLLARFRAEFR